MQSDRIHIDYLTWVKDLDEMLDRVRVRERSNYYNLAGSAIQEPVGIFLAQLADHLDEHRPELEDRLREPNAWGQQTLIKCIAKKYQVRPESVHPTTRASEAIFLVCQTFLANGGYAIVESPVYEPLLAAPLFLGAQVSFVERRIENGFQLDPDDLERELKRLPAGQPKLVILTNLHNPTGAQLSDITLTRIADLATEYNTWVMIDEIYHDFVLTTQKTATHLSERFITVSSFAKVYGLNILRCGWIIASPDFIERIRQVYVVVENDGSRLSETLSAFVFENMTMYNAHWSDILSRNRPIVEGFAMPLIQGGFIEGNVPREGCIYFPKLLRVDGEDAMKRFIEWLNTEYRVFVGPGHMFRAPGHVRIGFGGDAKEIEQGLQRLDAAIRSGK